MGLSNDEASRLEEILAALSEIRSQLRPREQEFVDDVTARYDEHGADLRLSKGQWNWLEGLYERA